MGVGAETEFLKIGRYVMGLFEVTTSARPQNVYRYL